MGATDDFALYGDRSRQESETPLPSASCPSCGAAEFEDGFVENAAEGQVRWFEGLREVGVFGVRRFGLRRRPVTARRCLHCSRLELFAGDVE